VQPPTTGFGIARPLVEPTLAGTEQVAAWRDRQLLAIGIAWAAPLLALLTFVALNRLGSRELAGLALLLAALLGASAPGLTVVFLLRRWRASRLAASMPAMPRASVRAPRRGAAR
jgi:hypothetical protein